VTQKELIAKADKYFVGGSLGEFHLPPEVAMVFSHGKGSKLYDVEGKEYVDYLLGSGPMIIGHCHPAVVEAVQQQIQKGTTFFGNNEPVIHFGERIVEATPCGEKIRFVNTGSDAVMYALRMARAHTGRDKVLRFEGGWHGISDWALHSARSLKPGDYPKSTPDGAGIPKSLSDSVLVAPFNNAELAVEIIENNANDLAAVLIEPLQRCIVPKTGFFEAVREATKKHGIIMVFDEVVTGFRLAWGGAQERYGVVPDLAALGKTISGGYPNAAVCGRADVMDTVNAWREPSDPKRAIASGTFAGYPIGAVAGNATLDVLEQKGTYERLFEMGDRLKSEIKKMGKEFSIPLKVGGDGPVLQVLFTKDEEILNYESMLYADKAKAYTFGIEMIKRGFFVSPFEKIYLSAVHTDEDISRTLEAMRDVLKTEISGS
jgi:glutamate-1-semialdehyde 2,1-aminomutase